MPVSETITATSGRTFSRWLLAISLGNLLIVSVGLAAMSWALAHWGALPHAATSTSLGAFRDLLTLNQGTDSWEPMLQAVRVHEAGEPIYDTLFFKQSVKFQYPLTSLLPLIAMRKFGLSDDRFLALIGVLSSLAVVVTVGFCVAGFLALTRLSKQESRLASVAIVIAGFCFYPLDKGFALGQIQTFLSASFVIAWYCWLRGKDAMSGVLIALMVLMKPQYAVIVLWFALRKRYRAFTASLAVLGAGFGVALIIFGWREQIKYLDVIAYVGRRGESYYPNLSFNGIANRLFFNGPNLQFDPNAFAPFHPWVYAITVFTSLTLVGLALWYPFAPGLRGSLADFCAVMIAATAASPVVWEHHYGTLLPAFVLMLATAVGRREWILTTIAYVLVANAWTPLNVLATIPILNVFQSVSFAGVLLLFALLLRADRETLAYASWRGIGSAMPAVKID